MTHTTVIVPAPMARRIGRGSGRALGAAGVPADGRAVAVAAPGSVEGGIPRSDEVRWIAVHRQRSSVVSALVMSTIVVAVIFPIVIALVVPFMLRRSRHVDDLDLGPLRGCWGRGTPGDVDDLRLGGRTDVNGGGLDARIGAGVACGAAAWTPDWPTSIVGCWRGWRDRWTEAGCCEADRQHGRRGRPADGDGESAIMESSLRECARSPQPNSIRVRPWVALQPGRPPRSHPRLARSG